MTLPLERKQQLLGEFHENLYKEGWTFTESGPAEKDRMLLEEFDIVIKEFIALKPVCGVAP
jgi:farnesyl-diphosphate farnesyltransferase